MRKILGFSSAFLKIVNDFPCNELALGDLQYNDWKDMDTQGKNRTSLSTSTFFRIFERNGGRQQTTNTFLNKFLYGSFSITCQYIWYPSLSVSKPRIVCDPHFSLLIWNNVRRYRTWQHSFGIGYFFSLGIKCKKIYTTTLWLQISDFDDGKFFILCGLDLQLVFLNSIECFRIMLWLSRALIIRSKISRLCVSLWLWSKMDSLLKRTELF